MVNIGIIGGHGGSDRGTTAGGIVEADVNLAFTKDLVDALQTLWPELNVVLLRPVDEPVPLGVAAALAAEVECDLVLVHHVNAHVVAPLTGGSCYYWPGDAVARQVGDAILGAYPSELRPLRPASWPATNNLTADDDWLQRPRAVLGPYATRRIPAVLVEGWYASHAPDRAAYEQRWVRERLMLASCVGVARFMGLSAAQC